MRPWCRSARRREEREGGVSAAGAGPAPRRGPAWGTCRGSRDGAQSPRSRPAGLASAQQGPRVSLKHVLLQRSRGAPPAWGGLLLYETNSSRRQEEACALWVGAKATQKRKVEPTRDQRPRCRGWGRRRVHPGGGHDSAAKGRKREGPVKYGGTLRTVCSVPSAPEGHTPLGSPRGGPGVVRFVETGRGGGGGVAGDWGGAGRSVFHGDSLRLGGWQVLELMVAAPRCECARRPALDTRTWL